MIKYPVGVGIGQSPRFRPPLRVRFLAMAENHHSLEAHPNSQAQEKVHFHYNHTDPCRYFRWTARESYQFMYARPWEKVNNFYSDMVSGRVSLSQLFGKETCAIHDDPETVEDFVKPELVRSRAEAKSGRWARLTFKIVLSYHGSSFDGWQKQPGLNTVQGLIELCLGKFVDDMKAQQLKDRNLPLEGCAVVAGRTDKGVSASQQVCSFYTWRNDVRAEDIKDAINGVVPGKIKVVSVNKVPREFHPNFSAKWRRYVYLFPLNDQGDGNPTILSEDGHNGHGNDASLHDHGAPFVAKEYNGDILNDNEDEGEVGTKPTNFEVSKVNQLLNQLEGKLLSYKMFARDTKASRNVGPPTECFVFHARAAEASLSAEDESCTKIMCIELVANRFLRKMVRVLVATAIREAAAGAEEDALLKLMDATCRRATAPPAPPDGLCLVDVGYTDFDKRICLIS